MRRIINSFCRFPFLSLLAVSFLLYLPVFLTPFTFHNDGSIVSCKGGGLFNTFDESHWIFLIGRPLYTIYLNLQAMVIHSVAELSASRLFYFFQMSLALLVLWRFLKRRCRVNIFWLWLMSLSFFFIPFNLLSFLWAEMQAVGAPTILLAGLSYYLWDDSTVNLKKNPSWNTKIKSILSVTGAAILFEMALCIYPSSALMVFVFTFARVLFSFAENKKLIRRIIIQDLLFFGALMVLYLVLVKIVIVPFCIHHFQMTPPDGLYAFSLTGNILAKLNLFLEILDYSLRGSLDLIGHVPGNRVIICFLIATFILGRKNFAKYFQQLITESKTRWFFIERVSWGLILIFAANAPLILAGGCDHIIGYRVLLPSTMMFIMVLFKLLMHADSNEKVHQSHLFLTNKFLAIVFTAIIVIISVWMEVLVVHNNHLEYLRAKEQLQTVDLSQVNRLMFLLNPRENKTPSGRILPEEMGLMSASKNHAAAYLSKIIKAPRLSWPLVQATEQGETIYLTPRTAIIDLTINHPESTSALEGRDVILLNPLSAQRNHIVIDTTIDKETGVFLTFKTVSKEEFLPFWLVTSDEPFAILQIDSLNRPRILSKCVVFSETRNAQGVRENIGWRLQASNDGKSWINLETKSTKNIFNIISTEAFRHYRFIWGKAHPSQNIYIHALKLFLP